MNRRTFATSIGKGLAVLAVLPLVTFETGCSVFADILKYTPLALSAVAAVVGILTGNGILLSPAVTTGLTLIKAAFADLQVAVQQYQDATQGQQLTLKQKISELLTIAEADIQKFWNDLSIPDPKLAGLIEGLLGVITTTLMGFASQLPASNTVAAAQAKTTRAQLAKHLPDTPTKRTPAQFKKAFNAQLAQGGEQNHLI